MCHAAVAVAVDLQNIAMCIHTAYVMSSDK